MAQNALIKALRRFAGWVGAELKVRERPPRAAPVRALALVAAVALIVLATLLLPSGGGLAVFLLDHGPMSAFPYPFTIQNLMHGLFLLGLAEIFVRGRTARWEAAFLAQGYLPEDGQTVLEAHELGPIRQRVAHAFDAEHGFLPSLIDLSILQFQASRSVDQTVSVLNAALELINHRLDLRYQSVRYLVWVIPTIGFIGTVVGIAGALSYVNPDNMDLARIAGNLGIAFNTTIIALIESAVLVLLQHVVQKREEGALNAAGSYTLKNLINRLYVGDA
ncbi:MAG: hypothetical protein Tsb0016_01670 [Sphingomonadales bacterium]